jgi:Ni/Co efflux regulator RcnB
MKKILSTALLSAAFALTTSAGAAHASDIEGKLRKEKAPAVVTEQTQTTNATQQKKGGTDCSPQRAGVRCSRPKPKKPWFFGR